MPHTLDAGQQRTKRAARPWGLRGMQPAAGIGIAIEEWRYDHTRQLALRPCDQSSVFLGQTAPRTYSVPDPGQEDALPDFTPDAV